MVANCAFVDMQIADYGPCFRAQTANINSINFGKHDGARTHGTRFERDIQTAICQTIGF